MKNNLIVSDTNIFLDLYDSDTVLPKVNLDFFIKANKVV